MVNYSISEESVKESIDYFKSLNIKGEFFYLYLLAKAEGIGRRNPVTFKATEYGKTGQNKESINRNIWLLGGLNSPEEKGESRSTLLPSGFSDNSFYQKGSTTAQLHTRVKDTIEKTNTSNGNILENDNGLLTTKKDTQALISEKILNNIRISASMLAAWLFRFSEFEFITEPNSSEFNLLIKSVLKKLLNLDKSDYIHLLEDDFYAKKLKFSSNRISGEALRSFFSFDDENSPNISLSNSVPFSNTQDQYSSEDVQKLISIEKNNIDENDILNLLSLKKQVILTGVPGVGKSHISEKIIRFGNYAKVLKVQFHPSYSYSNFILKETLVERNGATVAETVYGDFLKFCQIASEEGNRDKKYLFIIDEINRGNIPEIFGETILALDRKYSVNLSSGTLADSNSPLEFRIPPNLFILGTMNNSDRSIALLDLAIRRRFAFVEIIPDYDFISEAVSVNDYEEIDLGVVLRTINNRIFQTLNDKSLLLGHSYLLPEKDLDTKMFEWTPENLRLQFNYVLLPTLSEYAYNDASLVETIIGSKLAAQIRDTDSFMTALIELSENL